MGPGIVLLFWLFVAGVFAFGWAIAVGIFLLSWRKKWRVLKWLSGFAAGGLTAIALLVAALFSYSLVRMITPRFVFKDTFNVAPGPAINAIQSQTFWFADEGNTYLRFETDAASFRSLVPKGLPRVTLKEYQEKRWRGNDMGPAWWTYDFPSDAEIYLLTTEVGKGNRFASEMILMAYVPEQRLAYYHYIGID